VLFLFDLILLCHALFSSLFDLVSLFQLLMGFFILGPTLAKNTLISLAYEEK